MGSITSFPVLCILNATLIRWSIECAERKEFSLRNCKACINGDDCAVNGPEGVAFWWRLLMPYFGFVESIGKVSESREFVEMNSTPFKYANTKGAMYTPVGYVNFGLLVSKSRGAAWTLAGLEEGDRPEKSGGTLGVMANELIRMAPAEMRDTVMDAFVRANKVQLNTYKVPWFVPEWLGGLGLPTPKEDLSKRDAQKCQWLIDHWGEGPKPRLVRIEGSWHMRDMAELRIAEGADLEVLESEAEPGETENLDGLLALKAVDLLFDSDVPVSTLFHNTMSDAKAVYKRNEKIWLSLEAIVPANYPRADKKALERKMMREFVSITTVTDKGEHTKIENPKENTPIQLDAEVGESYILD